MFWHPAQLFFTLVFFKCMKSTWWNNTVCYISSKIITYYAQGYSHITLKPSTKCHLFTCLWHIPWSECFFMHHFPGSWSMKYILHELKEGAKKGLIHQIINRKLWYVVADPNAEQGVKSDIFYCQGNSYGGAVGEWQGKPGWRVQGGNRRQTGEPGWLREEERRGQRRGKHN